MATRRPRAVDRRGAVDAADLEFFDLCLSGPTDDRPQRCVPADFNRDRHVDLADFAVVLAAAARP
jgi:hypothetical protein